MTPNKPYLLRALYEWILDNGFTPHLIIDVHAEEVNVPSEAVRDGKLILNVSPRATRDLDLGNDAISFSARFSGQPHGIFLPIDAVLAIYAKENGQGMMFAPDKQQAEQPEPEHKKPPGTHLKLIK